jgi:hypothetical protein
VQTARTASTLVHSCRLASSSSSSLLLLLPSSARSGPASDTLSMPLRCPWESAPPGSRQILLQKKQKTTHGTHTVATAFVFLITRSPSQWRPQSRLQDAGGAGASAGERDRASRRTLPWEQVCPSSVHAGGARWRAICSHTPRAGPMATATVRGWLLLQRRHSCRTTD